MAYVDVDGLVARFGAEELIQLTDRTNMPPSTIDTAVVEKAIADASSQIDGYLAKRYRLPLDPVPSILSKVAADLARYHLRGDSAEKDTVVAINYRGSIDWLRDVSKGVAMIDAAGIEPVQAGTGAIKAKPSDRVFTRDSLRGA